MKKHTSVVTTGSPDQFPAFPAQWFTAYFVISSVSRALLPPSPAAIAEAIVAGLISASGYQDHTTSPSAAMSFVSSTLPRPSHPAPNVRDDRETPLIGHGRASF
jgi:hypothetical protein